MRQILFRLVASVGMLGVFLIALHNACGDKPNLGRDKAGIASLNRNDSATATKPATPQSSAAAVLSKDSEENGRENASESRISARTRKDSGKRRSRHSDEVVEFVSAKEPPRPISEVVQDSEGSKRMSTGVLQASAIKRVEPTYPSVARSSQVSGSVVIEITIDESGTVTSARAISGHPLLREAAVNAARQWRFKPALVNGVPIKVIGNITFNFVL